MKPQNQLDPSPSGDCLRAALACLLNEPVETVPNFTAIQGPPTDGWVAWYHALQSWLAVRGLAFLEFTLTKDTPFYGLPHETLCILAGNNPQGHRHAVVGKVSRTQFIQIHDPSPFKHGIKEVDSVCFLVPLDPALIHRDPPETSGASLSMIFSKDTRWVVEIWDVPDEFYPLSSFDVEKDAMEYLLACSRPARLKIIRNLQSVELVQIEKPHLREIVDGPNNANP